jgi:hypothetical protein
MSLIAYPSRASSVVFSWRYLLTFASDQVARRDVLAIRGCGAGGAEVERHSSGKGVLSLFVIIAVAEVLAFLGASVAERASFRCAQEMEEMAVQSHKRAAEATKEGRFKVFAVATRRWAQTLP